MILALRLPLSLSKKTASHLAVPISLLNFNFGAGFFQFSRHCFCICFAYTFFKRLWSTVNEILGFFQTQSSQILNDLNNIEFVCTSALQDNIESGLFFSSRSCTTSSRSGSNCNCSSS